MPIRVLIVDDESLARDTIRLLLEDHGEFNIVGECKDGDEAVEAIRADKPDLVFLDIQMPGKNGFDVVEAVGPEHMPVVIFATAYDQYALRAFEAHALDYLLKPYDDERFEKALDRAVKRIKEQQIGALGSELMSLVEERRAEREAVPEPDPATPLERIMIKERDALFFVKVEDIDWIEAAGDYVSLHVDKKSHLLRESMTGMEAKLDAKRFVRIHRSTIVNVERIKELRPYFHGDYIVYLKDGTELRLSRRYWNRLEQIVGSR
jgi:two-component system LytT family response regulator